jgi:hypothetical protein
MTLGAAGGGKDANHFWMPNDTPRRPTVTFSLPRATRRARGANARLFKFGQIRKLLKIWGTFGKGRQTRSTARTRL